MKNHFMRRRKNTSHNVRDFPDGVQKMILKFDGYREHMTPRLMDRFYKSGVVVHALPVHLSGKL